MVFLLGVSERRIVQCLVACGNNSSFATEKNTQSELPSLDSYRDELLLEAAACGQADAGPRSVAAVGVYAAAVVTFVAVVGVAVSADL